MTKKIIISVLVFLLVAAIVSYLSMRILWWFIPEKAINIELVNKSVLSTDGSDHSSIFWVLKNSRFVKTDKYPYQAVRDYRGIFTSADGQFKIDDYSMKDNSQKDSICKALDILYYADTYGIYGDRINEATGTTLLYGGMDSSDIYLLRKAKEQGKVIISEFNILQSPTPKEQRKAFEETFGIEWTGWVGKYFSSLHPSDPNLPAWLVSTYERQHKTQWSFSSAGIVFVRDDEQVEVFEEGSHFDDATPVIRTFSYGLKNLGMTKSIEFTRWFDVVAYNDSINHSVSAYELKANEQGRNELARLGIPLRIPAVIMHAGSDYTFFYFCGNFSVKPVSYKTASFSGVRLFNMFIRDLEKDLGGDAFFYRFYAPMLSRIIENEYESKQRRSVP